MIFGIYNLKIKFKIIKVLVQAKTHFCLFLVFIYLLLLNISCISNHCDFYKISFTVEFYKIQK